MNKGHWIAVVIMLAFLLAIASAVYVAFVPAREAAPVNEIGAGISVVESGN